MTDQGTARFQRAQKEWREFSLEQYVPAEARVRAVWAYVESLDLSGFYAQIHAVEGVAGRDPIDPKILLALWLYATIEGIGSAREVARLCERHLNFLWLCGGVPVNYHTLSDFRTQQAALLDDLLTQSVASLLAAGAVELTRLAQDGMRVRAAAGSSSFRRQPMIEQIEQRYGQRPDEYLADGGFVKLTDITQAEAQGIAVYLPIMEEEQKLAKGLDPYAPLKVDTPEVAQWRARMGAAQAKAIYPERAASAELTNAGCRNRGLWQFLVRGLKKVKAVTLWHALANNFHCHLRLIGQQPALA